MYTPAYFVRLAALTKSLSAGSPARITAARREAENSLLEFDLFVRVCVMLGILGKPLREGLRARDGGVRGLQNKMAALLNENPAEIDAHMDSTLLDSRQMGSPNFYEVSYRAAVAHTKTAIDPTEAALDLFADFTAGNGSTNLYYDIGKKINGKATRSSINNTIGAFGRLRAIDLHRIEQKQKQRYQEYDAPQSDDGEGRSLSETLSKDPADFMSRLLDMPEGRDVLQLIDRNMDFTGAEAQRIVWDALKEDPSLFSSNMGLARAYAERTGNTVSPQGVGQVKLKVVEKAQAVARANPRVQDALERLSDLSRLRFASAKKKRLASLLRKADVIKHAYDGRMLDSALDMLKDADTALDDLVDVLDARANGEGSISDTFSAAAELSKWLRGDTSKQFDTYAKKFREQARGKTAARYARDPYWMVAKYPGKDKNGKPFRAGERVFYYPLTKTVLMGAEAEKAARDFAAHAFDEDGF